MEEPHIIRVISELDSRLNHENFTSNPFLETISKDLTFALGNINWFICALDEQLQRTGGVVNKAWIKKLKFQLSKLQKFLDDIDVLIEGDSLQHPKNYSMDVMRVAKPLENHLKSLFEETSKMDDGIGSISVVGREKEREDIVKLLVDDDDDHGGFLVIPIIGMIGVGKTKLARFVFNDARVEKHFRVKIWVSLPRISTADELLWTVLESLDYQAFVECGVFEVITLLQKAVRSIKYLLVLDDYDLEEDHQKWLLLKLALCGSNKGSRVIVTSRSPTVAVAAVMEGLQMPSRGPYELGPLSKEAAWTLFKSIAFDKEKEKRKWFKDFGFDIFEKCANLPLVVKAIATLLSSQDTMDKWGYLVDVLRVEDFVKVVQSTSRLISYNHQLQSCIEKCCAYCSLYPKGYEFDKAHLIRVWMALGFIQPWTSDKENDEFFKKYLIDEHFFDIAKRDSTGAVVSYKMNYIASELMKVVAEDDCCSVDMATQHIDDKSYCHMSFIVNSSREAPSWLVSTKQLQSLLFLPMKSCEVVSVPNIEEILSNQRGLRVLDLAVLHCENLPDCIGELKDLRYFRLGVCCGILPKCITRLENLQTLDLRLSGVRELPCGFVELCRLRHLYIGERLTDLPPNFGLLTSLQTLDLFIVGKNNRLDELSRLTGLAGKLGILYEKRWGNDVLEECVGMLTDRYLTDLSLSWSNVCGDEAVDIGQEIGATELEFLQPPSTLKNLAVKGWNGMRFPQWATNGLDVLLHNLISVQMVGCSRCKHLPSFSALPHLRSLQLWDLNGLEYIEIYGDRNSSTTAYFPSLEYLVLANLPEVKGLSRLEESDVNLQGLENHEYLQENIFPRLSVLCLSNCPKLLLFPLAPRLEFLEAGNIHGKLLKHLLSDHESTSSSSPPPSSSSLSSRLLGVDIFSVWGLESLSINVVTLESLAIRRCHELINVVVQSQTPLQQFHICECTRLKDISFAQQSLSMLEELEIEHCEELDWGHLIDDDDDIVKSLLYNSFSTGGPWKGLKNLRSLKLISISKLEILPRGLGCLTTLQELSICWIYNLRALPEWIGYCLTQLRQLTIWCCPKLTILPVSLGSFPCLHQLKIKECPKLVRKCQKPHGEYWPLIQNIPSIQLGELSQ